MGRSYLLSKQLKTSQADEILKEITSIPDIKKARFSADLTCLDIETNNQDYYNVMSCIVNVFSRNGDGCSLSFYHFIY